MVYLLSTLLHQCFFLLFVLLHSLNPSLVAPAKERRCVNVWVSVVFIITDLEQREKGGGREGSREEEGMEGRMEGVMEGGGREGWRKEGWREG